VEGYFDMVSLYQNGVQNVAASLGTALTENQIYLLKRFADTIYIYYDTDKAGIAAAMRAIEKMFEQNINPRVIASDAAKDPDDFIRQNGLKAFKQLLNQSSDGFRFLINQTVQAYDLKIPERKNQAVAKVMYFVEKFAEPIIRDEYIRMTADFFKVDEKLLKTKSRSSAPASVGASAKGLTITPAERIFLRSTLAMPELVDSVKDIFNDKLLSPLVSKNIIRFLFQNYNPHTKTFDDYGRKLKQLSEAEQAEFLNIFKDSEAVEKDEIALKDAVKSSVEKFIDIFNKEEFKRIDRQIKIAERENNSREALRLTQEKFNFIKSKYSKNRGGAVEIL
jgi:DNA primase